MPQTLTSLAVIIYREVVYMPTMAQIGVAYMQVEPIASCPAYDPEAFRSMLLEGMHRGNPVAPIPATFKGFVSPLVAYVGVRSYVAIEKSADIWSVKWSDVLVKIMPTKRCPKGGHLWDVENAVVIPRSGNDDDDAGKVVACILQGPKGAGVK